MCIVKCINFAQNAALASWKYQRKKSFVAVFIKEDSMAMYRMLKAQKLCKYCCEENLVVATILPRHC